MSDEKPWHSQLGDLGFRYVGIDGTFTVFQYTSKIPKMSVDDARPLLLLRLSRLRGESADLESLIQTTDGLRIV